MPACALDAGGDLMCWGDWRNMLLDVPEGRFSGLSAGHGYACAVRGDSAVVCWGAFSPPGENAGSFTRVSVGDPRSWERFHACALGADGNVMCCVPLIADSPSPRLV